ncbi:dihydropteroate synthase [Flavitalea sp. BT771]|uniref:dihydropteroate synthase n=1 Tax=Flavitalea sp. BT771 TaxID=3063329 RepID=UPI0026E48874|nr:dihydropteroate synthase [Flavitalea sp. BT771]MDO6434519.1 dihydropteroate synthase [Flavitalea sp. BT771]MDV6223419.1 dihydropteroate synthase [Flavitalea sp. BT771]
MFTLNGRGKLLAAERPLVMGILNSTPDSFYGGSRFNDDAAFLQQAEKMVREGAAILDIGGQSTRPGAAWVGEEEELRRVVPRIALLSRQFPQTFLSVDTWYARVAQEAVAAGASMVNDVSGGLQDPAMLPAIGRLGVPYVCMHMKGTPATMNKEAVYADVTKEVLDFFISRVQDCRDAGIRDIILDPGMGFAKTRRHNLELLHNLSVFCMLGYPILLGVSRKSTIYKLLDITPEEALNGTTVLNTLGLVNGADILRVHDPREARQAIILAEAYKEAAAP